MNYAMITTDLISVALQEDLPSGLDVTTEATVPAGMTAIATITPQTAGILSGSEFAWQAFDRLTDGRVEVLRWTPDGTQLAAGQTALMLRGDMRALLTAERTALNLLCHLSGVATLTAQWVAEISGTNCILRDTRKTLPGLRSAEKDAVRHGGGVNHRFSLSDAVLIKDNHLKAAGSVTAALSQVHAYAPGLPRELEVDDLEQLDEALAVDAALRPTVVLLDNFTPEQCTEAVSLNNTSGRTVKLEASGGITLATARAYATTGVDYLAVGALTHSVPALDLSMDVTPLTAESR